MLRRVGERERNRGSVTFTIWGAAASRVSAIFPQMGATGNRGKVGEACDGDVEERAGDGGEGRAVDVCTRLHYLASSWGGLCGLRGNCFSSW